MRALISMLRAIRRRSGAPGGDLAQRLLEQFGRLAALDQMAIVDDHRRHRMDAELLPVALARADLVAELAVHEDLAGTRRVEADLAGQFDQHVVGARIAALAVI